jgi:hypothetical protein
LIGTGYTETGYKPCLDFDHDLLIGASDLTIMSSWYGTSPPTDCLSIP